jgi:hypothetical protein
MGSGSPNPGRYVLIRTAEISHAEYGSNFEALNPNLYYKTDRMMMMMMMMMMMILHDP